MVSSSTGCTAKSNDNVFLGWSKTDRMFFLMENFNEKSFCKRGATQMNSINSTQKSTEGQCIELLMQLRRSLTQQSDVRLAVYEVTRFIENFFNRSSRLAFWTLRALYRFCAKVRFSWLPFSTCSFLKLNICWKQNMSKSNIFIFRSRFIMNRSVIDAHWIYCLV